MGGRWSLCGKFSVADLGKSGLGLSNVLPVVLSSDAWMNRASQGAMESWRNIRGNTVGSCTQVRARTIEVTLLIRVLLLNDESTTLATNQQQLWQQTMTSSKVLRRSSRIKQRVYFEEDISYPDGPPVTPVERWVSRLDQETFPGDDYARIDDIVVYCLFASKRSPRFYRALRPTRAFLEDEVPIPIDTALDICRAYLQLAKTSSDSPSVASAVSNFLTEKYPNIFRGERDGRILKQ